MLVPAMGLRSPPLLPRLLPLLVLLLPSCVDAETRLVLDAKGGGTLSVDAKFSKEFGAAAQEVKRIHPPSDPWLDANPLLLEKPEGAAARKLKEAGLKVSSMTVKKDRAGGAAKWKAEFDRLGALPRLKDIAGGPLQRGPAGLGQQVDPWKGLVALRDAGEGNCELEVTYPVRVSVAIDVGAVAEGMLQLTMAVAEVSEETLKMKNRLVLEVPGTILSFAPAELGKTEEPRKGEGARRAVFTFGRGEAGKVAGGTQGDYHLPKFTVKFRPDAPLPPEALWPAPAAGKDGK